MMSTTEARPKKNTAHYGANTPAGSLNSLSKTTWWEIKGKVMAAAKEVLLDCLSPKHHDQWEFAAHKCFQLGFKKITKLRKPEDDSQDDAKHTELLRRVARLYINSKQDGVPRDQLNAICAVVNTTVSMDEWNEVLKEVQREMVLERQLDDHAMLLNQSSVSEGAYSGDGEDNSSNMMLPPPHSIQDHQHPQQAVNTSQEQLLHSDMQEHDNSSQAVRVSWRGWQQSKEDCVESNASISRLLDREYERRCKSYDSNKAISTAIRLIEAEPDALNDMKESSSSCQDPLALVIQNRLGYQSAKIFASKLDIMQKIIRAFREAENNEEKDFLLGLVSGSFTRDEVNKIIVPPEAQIMLPGRVRNTALISGHKWTAIRKAAGCPNVNPKLEPEKYSESVKKRKRTIEERRLLANTSYPDNTSNDAVLSHVV